MNLQELVPNLSHAWAPPPKLSLSDWADENRVLSSESGAAAGRWKTLPYQREIFDSFTDCDVRTTVVMTATQMVKTEFVLNAIGYIVDQNPGPTLLILPRDSDCDRFSKIRLGPMCRDTECLRDKLVDMKATGRNTLDFKKFTGGHLTIVASGSPGNLAALPIKFLIADELDLWPVAAGSGGSPLALAQKRQATYFDRKSIYCSSPSIDGESGIQREFLNSDQREYLVPCWSCHASAMLDWEHVRWDNTLATKKARAATAHYECPTCGVSWNDLQRWKAVEAGYWEAAAPFAGVAGFHISELCSPWKTLNQIVLDFLSKKDNPLEHQVFKNTTLAEVWTAPGDRPAWQKIYERREQYGENGIPAPVLMLVAAVDVMEKRLEFAIMGYSRTRESWQIAYEVIPGDPVDTSPEGPWASVEKLLMVSYPHELGGRIPIFGMAIDTGEKPAPAYWFASHHAAPTWSPVRGGRVMMPRTVVLIKGNADAQKLISNVSDADAARKRGGLRIYSVGTIYAKTELYDLLRLERQEGGEVPPWYPHFPEDYGPDYFKGLCSERRVVHANGSVTYQHDPSIPNEPLDLLIYCRAVAELCGLTEAPDGAWDAWEAMCSRPVADDELSPVEKELT